MRMGGCMTRLLSPAIHCARLPRCLDLGAMNALQIPNITLSDGNEIPQVGLGVFLVDPGETNRRG